MRLLPIFTLLSLLVPAHSAELACFELRTYYAADGKLDGLHARFRDHTLELFEKHGITNLAYWVPLENTEGTMLYLLGYPDKAARETSWKSFLADPEWIAAKGESEKEGKLVARIESLFLRPTEYSPALPIPAGEGSRIFELRHYTTHPDKLDALDARFRDHTLALFEKHGMVNLPYFHLDDGQEGAEVTLLYFLAHESEESSADSFKTFSQDPDWQAARNASEKDGEILVEKGVASTLLRATDYSPVQ